MRMSDIKSDVTEEEITQLLAKVDKESTFRKLSGYQYRIVYWMAVAFSCFQFYTAMFGAYPAQIQRSVHLSFAFVLVFLLYPFRTKTAVNRLRVQDYLFAAFAACIGMYLTINYTRLMETAGDYTKIDMIVGVCGTLLTLEAARRVVGTPHRRDRQQLPRLRLLRGVSPRLPLAPRLFHRADRLPYVLHHGGNPRHPAGRLRHLHLPLHPLRRVPGEDRHREAVHRHRRRHRRLGRRGSGQGGGHHVAPWKAPSREARWPTPWAPAASPSP